MESRLVASQGTAADKACSPPSSQFIWAEIAGSLICSAGRATTQKALSYSGERDPLARRGADKRKSLDASIRCSALEDIGKHTLLGPQQVPFLCVFFLQGVSFLCHLVLC
jgi:hypothetical protein